MNWFTRLFKGKPQGPPRLAECPRSDYRYKRHDCGSCSLEFVCDDPGKASKAQPGSDIIGRQIGHNVKRNRVHIYRQPFGYPIRLCDWIAVNPDGIEEVGRCQGLGGPAAMDTLAMALDWRENLGDRVCRHCKAAAQGKRTSIGMEYHGHGKGVA